MKYLPTALGLCFILTSCASVKVDERSVQTTQPLSRPAAIYVSQFDHTKGIWKVDRAGNDLEVFKTNASLELQRMMIERLPEVAPTYATPDTLPTSGMLISGEFTRVNQGSRALRMGVGFGAGGTKVETIVRIYDLSFSSTSPVATFKTTGGSNAQPGWLAGGWVATGLNATGLESDWERTSREIRNFILERI
ncbi:MAG: DUF4410 domain-containing protein [Candidatus Methylacidiphilales bacterium]|nr:DUF4410 domain-containing protein [Candidatus Methylacidiphilales bacterium]